MLVARVMSTPNRSFHGITEYLAWDHDGQEDALLAARDAVDDGQLADALRHFDAYCKRLLRHMRLEEQILFPLIESLVPRISRDVIEMRLEHGHVQRRLGEARQAIDAGEVDAFRHAFDALGLILLAHEAREERIVYPILDRSLSPEQRADLATRLAQEP
jgi:iron-sulfur cluster repair protein YtfE (RIC family)